MSMGFGFMVIVSWDMRDISIVFTNQSANNLDSCVDMHIYIYRV